MLSSHLWLLTIITIFFREREWQKKETEKQKILGWRQKLYFLGWFSVRRPDNQRVWRLFETVPSMSPQRCTHTSWVIKRNQLHKFLCVLEKKQLAEMLHLPPCIPSSHLGSPHASAKAISHGFASYTVTTSEMLKSNFHFIPSIGDIQWYSVRPSP